MCESSTKRMREFPVTWSTNLMHTAESRGGHRTAPAASGKVLRLDVPSAEQAPRAGGRGGGAFGDAAPAQLYSCGHGAQPARGRDLGWCRQSLLGFGRGLGWSGRRRATDCPAAESGVRAAAAVRPHRSREQRWRDKNISSSSIIIIIINSNSGSSWGRLNNRGEGRTGGTRCAAKTGEDGTQAARDASQHFLRLT